MLGSQIMLTDCAQKMGITHYGVIDNDCNLVYTVQLLNLGIKYTILSPIFVHNRGMLIFQAACYNDS